MPPKKRKMDSTITLVASDSDTESGTDNDAADVLPHIREDALFHRAVRTDSQGRTQTTTTTLAVPASPSKKPPQRDLLDSDWSPLPPGNWETVDAPFPFAGMDSFDFDEGHPVDPVQRKERDSVRCRYHLPDEPGLITHPKGPSHGAVGRWLSRPFSG
jgi:hypothetical protein